MLLVEVNAKRSPSGVCVCFSLWSLMCRLAKSIPLVFVLVILNVLELVGGEGRKVAIPASVPIMGHTIVERLCIGEVAEVTWIIQSSVKMMMSVFGRGVGVLYAFLLSLLFCRVALGGRLFLLCRLLLCVSCFSVYVFFAVWLLSLFGVRERFMYMAR